MDYGYSVSDTVSNEIEKFYNLVGKSIEQHFQTNNAIVKERERNIYSSLYELDNLVLGEEFVDEINKDPSDLREFLLSKTLNEK